MKHVYQTGNTLASFIRLTPDTAFVPAWPYNTAKNTFGGLTNQRPTTFT